LDQLELEQVLELVQVLEQVLGLDLPQLMMMRFLPLC
jgi:hypothetical protein